MKVSLVIPALNEATTIGTVLDRRPHDWAAIVVDDGSSDDTGTIATAHGAVVLRHPAPRGYDAALGTGLDHARGAGFDLALSLDADGQLTMDSARRAVDALRRADADLALGRRDRFARWSEHVFSAYTRRRYGVRDILCGLKVYRLAAFGFLRSFDMADSIGTAVALAGLQHGLRWIESDVEVLPRADASRFGSGLKANLRIAGAAIRAMRRERAQPGGPHA